MSADPCWTTSSDVLVRRVGTSVVLAPGDREAGEPTVVTHPGRVLWDVLATEPVDVDRMVEAALAVFEGDRDAVRGQVRELLGQLRNHGYVREVPGEGGNDPVTPPRRQDLHWAVLGDEVVVHDPWGGDVHRLNRSAASVWERLDGAMGVQALARELARAHGVGVGTVQHQVEDLLGELRTLGLLAGDQPTVSATDGVGGGRMTRQGPVERESSLGQRACDLLAARDWRVELGPYRALDLTFAVRVDDDTVARHLGGILEPLLIDAGSYKVDACRSEQSGGEPNRSGARVSYSLRRSGGRWVLSADGHRLLATGQPRAAVERLLWQVNRHAIASAGDHTVFHAAGAARDGSGVLLPGGMNAGKSTLVTGLVEHGFGYLGDEAVALDREGVLHPYPKSIGVDAGSRGVLAHLGPTPDPRRGDLLGSRWHIPPQRVRRGSIAGPVPLEHVVVPCYEAGSPTSIESLSPAEALTVLLEQSFHLRGCADPTAGRDAFEQLARMCRRLPVHRLVSGSLTEAVTAVASLVEQRRT